MKTQITVDSIILEGFTASRNLLIDIFQTKDPEELKNYVKLIASLRHFEDEVLEKIARPLILSIFAEIECDPTTDVGRKDAAAYVDCMALAMQDAYTIIAGQAQQQEQSRKNLLKGRIS